MDSQTSTNDETKRQSLAVVGAGISGITAAYYLQEEFKVSLFEADTRLGGHTNTVTIPSGQDAGLRVDTGFIVLNDKNYSGLHSLLASLGVQVRFSDMSFAYACEESGFRYAGTGFSGLFGEIKNVVSPRFWRFLFEIKRFSKESLALLEKGQLSGISLREHLDRLSFSDDFRKHYLIPMAAAIWSSPDSNLDEFPAELFVRFFKNHGLLSFEDRPKWQTVVGGSSTYVEKFESQFSGDIFKSTPVRKVKRENQRFKISSEKGELYFDRVILALHADQARDIIEAPSTKESEALRGWDYYKNTVCLHTDETVLPENRRVWASWNYHRRVNQSLDIPVQVTYDMTRLQGLSGQDRYFVTLNGAENISKDKIVELIEYEHPNFTEKSLGGREAVSSFGGGDSGLYFCGAWMGNGFHEDGVQSALKVVNSLRPQAKKSEPSLKVAEA